MAPGVSRNLVPVVRRLCEVAATSAGFITPQVSRRHHGLYSDSNILILEFYFLALVHFPSISNSNIVGSHCSFGSIFILS